MIKAFHVESKKRDANLDLLRIVSMLLIIFLHSIDHSGVLEAAENASHAMYFYVRFTYALCQVCVNCYVMLSGYYLVKSTFRLQKLIGLWIETAFYAFVLKLLFMITGQESFSLQSLISCFFPLLTGRYWFITIYAGLYLVSPFLNLLINSMNRKQHLLLNICLFCLFSLWSSIHPAIAGMNSGGGWGLAWFVVLYFAAAWFRLYYMPNHRPVRKFLVYLTIPALIAATQLAVKIANIGILQTVLNYWFRYDSAPVYIMTLCLFTGFLNIQINSRKVSNCICNIAPLTLGVYLIHTHANVSPWLWELLALPEKMQTIWFPAIQLGCVLLIFCSCIVVDVLRSNTIGRLEKSSRLSRCCQDISQWLESKLIVKER